jgi:CTP synthase
MLKTLKDYQGILVPGGFGERGSEGKILAIRYARTNNIPFLGICYGLQLSIVEFSRNVLGLAGAHSTECNSNTPHPVIDLLPEQKEVYDLGGTMRLGAHKVILKKGSIVNGLYGDTEIFERHRHRWEVNPDYWEKLQAGGLVFSGISPDGRRIEAIELPDNHFFLATQFHPEFKSRPWAPSPPYYGFVKAAYAYKIGEV